MFIRAMSSHGKLRDMGTVPQGPLARLRAQVADRIGRGTQRLPDPVRRIVGIGSDVLRAGQRDDLAAHIGALSFAAFLSLFPLLLLSLATAGFVIDREEAVEALVENVPGLEDVVSQTLDQLAANRVGIGVVGLLTALWSASALGGRAVRSMGVVFDVPTTVVVARLRSMGATLALGASVLLSVTVSTALTRIEFGGAAEAPVELLVRLLLLVLVGLVFWAAYLLFTPAGVAARDHVPGALAATLAWVALIVLGELFVDRYVRNATALYGTIGALFGLLLFIRLAATAFLYAAELSAVLRLRRMDPPRADGPLDR
jgi:membrane protein